MGKKFKKKNIIQANKQEAEALLEVRNLFIEKEWEIDRENSNSLYSRTVEAIDLLSREEITFILKLLKKFSSYSLDDYKRFVLDAMVRINESLLIGEQKYTEKKIFIAPVVKTYSETSLAFKEHNIELREFKINSSSFLTYILKSKYLSYHSIVGNMDIVIDENINKKEFIQNVVKNEGKLVLVDDFSGTGKSILNNLDFYLSDGYIEQCNVFVVLMSYMEKAKNSILESYPDCNFIGLDECVSVQEVFPDMDEETLKSKIEKINSKLKISTKKEYLLGLEDTGSLTSLLRTPNNTLSTFWKSTSRGARSRAIFPRY